MLARSLRLHPAIRNALRHNSTSAAPAPALLSKLREDLKTAMRSKDKPSLSILRAVLAEVTNASKTTRPPASDMDILQIIRKTQTKSEASLAEFRAAGRMDLADSEAAQVEILKAYATSVDTVSVNELRAIALQRGPDTSGTMGEVIKAVLIAIGDRPVVKAEVAAAVRDVFPAIQELQKIQQQQQQAEK